MGVIEELTIRDWMVIIGVLLLVVVALDGWRRIRKERRAPVRMDLVDPDDIAPEPEDEFTLLKELPNGGGRLVQRGNIKAAAGVQDTVDAGVGTMHGVSEDVANAADVDGFSATRLEAEGEETMDWLDSLGSQSSGENGQRQGDASRAGLAQSASSLAANYSGDPEVFMLNVVARSPSGFAGEDILHILLACDLRFGDMNFFHRHEEEAGRGPIQFSVANMMEPGVFDIDEMSGMKTPGLVFFVTLPGPENMMQAFDYMLETAQAVARNLDGDVLDESRSVLTRQSLDHCRNKIRDLERRLLAQAR